MSTTALEHVMNYAAAFEETYLDDDWERLLPFFNEHAVYLVEGGPLACRIDGRAAILRGLKKSVDGLDRRFDARHIEITDGPQAESFADNERVMLSWRVSYDRAGTPNMSFPGRSVATVADDKIVELRDIYVDAELEPVAAWLQQYGTDLDGSYV